MKKLCFAFILGAVIASVAFAAPPTVAWQKSYDYSSIDDASGVAIDPYGYVFVIGHVSVAGNNLYKLVYYDPAGYEQGNTVYPRLGDDDYPSGIAVYYMGFIYVTGWAEEATDNFLTAEFNLFGQLERTFDTYDSGLKDQAQAIACDNSGNVYVTGNRFDAGHDARLIVKYNSGGGIDWAIVQDGTSETGAGVATDSYNRIYVVGSSDNGSNSDIYIVKLDADRNELAHNHFDFSGYTEHAAGVAVDPYGNVYVAGTSTHGMAPGDMDFLVIKYDALLNEAWSKTFFAGNNSQATGIAVDQLGNSYVCGYFNNGANTDYRLIKVTTNGDLDWDVTYDGGDNDFANGVAVDTGFNVVVTGVSRTASLNDDYLTIKYSQNSGLEEELVQLDNPVALEVTSALGKEATLEYSLGNQTSGTLSFYSADGRKVESYSLSSEQSTFTWDASGFSAGVYFPRIDAGGKSVSAKLILTR